jgi:hypothetical protein
MAAPMLNVVEYFQNRRNSAWETLSNVTFGLFMGGLVLLLVALYSGILVV